MTLLNSNSNSTRWRAKAAFAGIVVLFGFWIAAHRMASGAMRRAEAAVVALGSSLDPRQVVPALPADGQNAHQALEAARRWQRNDDQTLYRKLHNRLQREILKGGSRMTAEDVQLFRRAVEHYGPVLEILDSASSIDSARFEFDPDRPTFSQLPYLNATEHFADLLSARAQIALTEGRPATAWRDVRAIFRLAAWSSEEMPILVSQLMAYTAVGIATLEVHALLRGGAEPDAAEVAAVLAEARRPDLRAAFDLALEMERAEMVTWLHDENQGPGLIRSWFPGILPWLSARPLRPWLTFDLAFYAGAMTEFAADVGRPAFDRPAVAGYPGRLEAHYPVPAWAPLTRRLLNENLIHACNKRDDALASIDLMEIAFRLEEHRRSSGSYPPTLEGLGAIPVDPFSSKPYAYRQTASGAVLYSFGMDRDDDGGEPHPARSNGDWDKYQGDRVWFLSPATPTSR